MNRGARVEVTPPECALAAEMFDHFCAAGTMKQILALHREICNTLTLKPNRLPDFYPKLKAKLLSSWKAQALFKKFDARANHKVYAKGRACTQNKVLIIGAGPCGMRAAIECQLLGAKVVVIEKRDRMSRNNVLHLWPFVIQDLRALGAKKFFGKFCAGSIDHISIRQLQCILLKVALLLGVEFHEGVSFEELIWPTASDNSETLGWRARVTPADHPVAQFEFDSLLGADGKRNTLHGFKRKEFRAKLAMAITANFINRHSEQEASVPEISGVAFIFNQKFFKDLYQVTGIDLENIVYYKDDTHYFVMTAKKHSLLDKGVLLNDYNEVSRLLSVENVDRAALMRYAQEAARFSTDGKMPLTDFALNHYGEPDVALFDFTSMYAAENASMVYERHGRRLLCQLVGDSLLEPFWPTGSGCARGFLSALDAAWAVRAWGHSPAPHPLNVVAERESIYRLLAQTTPENMHRDFGAYTLDPGTRYRNLNRTAVTPHKVTSFYDSDEPLPLDATASARKRRREAEVPDEALTSWVGVKEGGIRAAASPPALTAAVRRYRPDLLPSTTLPRNVYNILDNELGIAPFSSGGTLRDVTDAKLRSYLTRVYNAFKGEVPHVHHETDVFDQIKLSMQKDKHVRNSSEHPVSAYSSAADADKSHSSYKRKRRAMRSPQVSNDPADYIRKKIGKLDLNDITQLARLIEGHDAISLDSHHTDKQKDLQDQILALLDPEESPDPTVLRESLAQLLQGNSKSTVTPEQCKVAHFFKDNNDAPVKPPRKLKGLAFNSIKIPDYDLVDEQVEKVVKPPRRLKGLDPSTIRVRNFHVDDSSDADVTLVTEHLSENNPASSADSITLRSIIPIPIGRRPSYIIEQSSRNFQSPVLLSRANSLEGLEVMNTKRIAQLFEGNKEVQRRTLSPRHLVRSGSMSGEMALRLQGIGDMIAGKRQNSLSPDLDSDRYEGKEEIRERTLSPKRLVRSGSMSGEMALRLQRMADMIAGKRQNTPSPDRDSDRNKRELIGNERNRRESIGNSELEMRKQRVVDLIEGHKPRHTEKMPRRESSCGEMMSFRLQRVNVKMEKKNNEQKSVRLPGRRKTARNIMKQRFEKSLQMLETEPRLEFATADLENDYGLQQYRASAPQFDERVKKLERQLQHYEEGRIVGGGGRTAGGGARVAKLAAELSGTNTNATTSKPSKPKDLMRSVGKIERDDWNMKEIERKILENKLGRPEPRTAEKVPKWDREQFLGRQRKLREGETGDEKWGEIDETLHKLDQKLRDSGRPDHGTKKVANLATKFVNEPEQPKPQPKEEVKKSWRGPGTAGVQCAACGTRVFAAEGVTADGLQLHRACFRCAVCKAVLRPGNYTMERYGSRLVCLRHSGVSVPDAVASLTAPQRSQAPTPTPERISLELSDYGAREIDEDEWTDRNCLASETSCAGGLSDEEESSSEEYTDAGESDNEERASPAPADEAPRHHHNDMYFSDDSFGYDDYSDDGAESSGNESCSVMREALEARRREVPADARRSSGSSEVESEEESESTDEVSSATEVSTDSEFAREESAPPPAPPAILVTEPTPPAPAPRPSTQDYPLSRTRSAGGIATKRALELKRKYLLGEPSPPAVRKSDSTSQIDTKFEAFRSNITEFQKMLNPAATSARPQKSIVAFRFTTEDKKAQPMPDIIKNLCTDAPVDLLANDTSLISGYISEKSEPVSEEKKGKREPDVDSDSLSEDDSSHTETAPQNVPRLEVHDEGGELIQLDSLVIVNSSEEQERAASGTGTATGPTVRAADSESSESGRDATTLALTETELSDWAAEANVLDECAYHEKEERKRSKNPRTLSGPKLVHDAKNIAAVPSHVCGRTSPTETIAYSNALEHFEFADEGDQDPSIETPSTPKNEGYMELVDDEFEYSPGNDRSMNFIERSFSETVMRPCHEISNVEIVHTIPKEMEDTCADSDVQSPLAEIESSEKSISENKNTDRNSDSKTESKLSDEKTEGKVLSNGLEPSIDSLSITEVSPQSKSPALFSKTTTESETLDDISPPLIPDTPTSKSNSILSSHSIPFSGVSIRLYSPAICRSASETFDRSTSRSTDSPSRSFDISASVHMSSGSVSPVSPMPFRDTTDKVQEIKREREEQTEVVRRLVLERLGSGGRVADRVRKSRRARLPPAGAAPPPVPPPPVLPAPPAVPPPPRPAPPLLPMPVTPSFSDPELARERRRKSIMKSISNYLNRTLGPRHKEPPAPSVTNAHKSMGALQEPAPPVPPPPAFYCTPTKRALPTRQPGVSGTGEEERDAMQLWFEARWARLVAQRRAREDSSREEPTARRLARLERRLTRPLSAMQQAATVAELVQVSAQRDAHQALMKADRRRSAHSSGD